MATFSDIPGAQAAVEQILRDLGPLVQPAEVPEEAIRYYVGRVPDIILDFWSKAGVGDLRGGMLRLCLPFELGSQMGGLFRGDPDFGFPEGTVDPNPPLIDPFGKPSSGMRHTDVHALAHTAFGDLLLWSERHGLMHVSVVMGMIRAPFLFKPDAAPDADTVGIDYFLKAPPEFLDMDDREMQPMYERAFEKFGPMKRMFIYAPGPAATGDPDPTINDLFPHSYPEWLEERIRSMIWTLADLEGQRLQVREIGKGPRIGR